MAPKSETEGPKRTPLSRERVFGAAVGIADRHGLGALTMRRLAETLGVEAMSLYHHVANKEAILDGMVDLVFSEIELPDPRAPWQDAMRARALSARSVLSRHGWAVGLMDSRANPGPATLRHHDAVIGSLRRGGFSIAATARAFSLIDSYIYGFVMQELSLPFKNAEELEQVADTILANLPATEFPNLTEMIVDHTLRPGYAYAKEFEPGLELILDGLDRLRDKRPQA